MRTIDQILDTKELRRLRAEDRMLDKLEKRELAAEPLIGQLCREGVTIYYVNIRNTGGKLTGKTKEGTHSELVAYLIRNNYV